MPRTLPAELSAAMASGTYTPYFVLDIFDVGAGANPTRSLSVLKYTLTAKELSATAIDEAGPSGDEEYVRIERGVTIGGNDYSITSSKFAVRDFIWTLHKRLTISATLLPNKKIAVAGDDTYENIITAVCALFSKTALFADDTADFWQYQFMPTGKQIVLNDAIRFFNMLRQKYLIEAHDSGEENITFFQNHDPLASATTLDLTDVLIDSQENFLLNYRTFLWKDEAATIHTYEPYTDAPLHNLGYLESTDDPPPSAYGPLAQSIVTTAPNLLYTDSDPLALSVGGRAFFNISEVLDLNGKTPWATIYKTCLLFTSTEGGALPSTIERVAAYTPLVTTNFDGLLDETVNNLQALAEAVDELSIPDFPQLSGDPGNYIGGDGLEHPLPTTASLFLNSINSSISGYETLSLTRPTGTETSASASVSAADTEIEQFAAPAALFDLITAQVVHSHVHLAQTGGAGKKDVQCYFKLFHRTAGGTETLIGTSHMSAVLTSSNAEYDLHASLSDTPFAATDIIVYKLFATPSGAGATPTATVYFEGSTESRIELGTQIAFTAAQVGAIPNDGWIAGTGTWSYSSADDPTFVISINANVTALIGVGDRIKLTQTSAKYFIVTAVGAFGGGATLVTVYGGTDYDLANAAISTPYYSPIKAPFGFPLDPDKWTVVTTDTSNRSQASAAQNTWYNLGTITISIPIGCWRVWYSVLLASGGVTATAANGFSTLSTANNSESDNEMTAFTGLDAGSAELAAYISAHKEKTLTLASKTSYYLNAKTSLATAPSLIFYGALAKTIIKAICAYL